MSNREPTIQEKIFACGEKCHLYRKDTKQYQTNLEYLSRPSECGWDKPYTDSAYVLDNAIQGLANLSEEAYKLLKEANKLWKKNPCFDDMKSLRLVYLKELKLRKLNCIIERCNNEEEEKQANENRKVLIAYIKEQIKNNVKGKVENENG